MKLTRERKIFGTVLVLAAVALAFDQVSGSGSSDNLSSSAAGAENPDTLLLASAGNLSGGARAGTLIALDEPSLAQRLLAAAPAGSATAPEQIRDVFRIPQAWLGSGQAIALSADSSKIAADRFLQVHKLTAVSKRDTGPGIAVVDGRLLHPGAIVDGFKLVAVTRSSAIFDCGGAQVLLQLKVEPNAAAATVTTSAGDVSGQ